ncbi:DUF2806 domain-containing protein [Lactococcus garvieae]|uniref:DUF2806 domain-containing protein n=1 Tax=Lactococcus petauri TaxID=1940789 RepID=UPI0013FE4A7C|nr:DUF2806 domain-containing protein [Lactococcus petauri]NHI73850.1 DUF2806 domain-containing protein [Lactococcus garvieae]NHI79760.1 DUF2806 domain-containing protein [Lactococcus petauri]NHJ18766.1 DUF2806 domain-containing protein [Lactococcus garvieae]
MTGNLFPEKFASDSLDKLEKLFGKLFPYVGLERQALENYIDNIEQTNLSPSDKLFATLGAKQKIKAYKNQNTITKLAIENSKANTDFSQESNVEEEWLARFMDSARFVSSQEAQFLWGQVLAGEFEEPGTFPISTIRILSELPVDLARIFTHIAQMRVTLLASSKKEINLSPVSYDIMVPITKINEDFIDLGISYVNLIKLENLGLINFESGGYQKNLELQNYGNIVLQYRDELIRIEEYEASSFPMGCVLLTDVGKCIANMINVEEIPDYVIYLKKYLEYKRVKLKITDQPKPIV